MTTFCFLGFIIILIFFLITRFFLWRRAMGVSSSAVTNDETDELTCAYQQIHSYSVQLEKKSLNLSAINNINQILNSPSNSQEIFSRVARFVAETFNAGDVFIITKIPKKSSLQILVVSGGSEQIFTLTADKRNWFYLSLFEAGHLITLNQEDLTDHQGEIFWTEHPLRNLAATPLSRGRDVFGALILGNLLQEPNLDDLDLLQITANQVSIATERSQMYDELKRNYLATISALTNSIEAKDAYTHGHSERVTRLAMVVGETMRLSPEALSIVNYGGMLHDIGKIGIDESILNKPGSLTDSEFSVIKRHPVIGEEIVASIPFLESTLPIIRYHHERFDGRGYPDKIAGKELPLEVRIISLCDAFDAMSSNRPYRKALSIETCLQEIRDKSGTQFDPDVADSFLQAFNSNLITFHPV